MDNSEGQTNSAHNKNYNAEIPSEKEIKHIDKNVEMNNKSEQTDPQNGEVSFIEKQEESPSEEQTHSTPNKIHDDCDMSAETEFSPEKETEQHIDEKDEEDPQNGEANVIGKQGETASESSSEDSEDDPTPTNEVLFQVGELQNVSKRRLDGSEVKHIELAEFRRYPDGEASQSNVPDQSSKRSVEEAMECLKLVETFQKNGQYDEALSYCYTALNVLEFSQDTNLRMKFYSNIMQLYFLKENVDAAINTYYDHCECKLEFVSDPKVIQSIVDMRNLCMKKLMKDDKI